MCTSHSLDHLNKNKNNKNRRLVTLDHLNGIVLLCGKVCLRGMMKMMMTIVWVEECY